MKYTGHQYFLMSGYRNVKFFKSTSVSATGYLKDLMKYVYKKYLIYYSSYRSYHLQYTIIMTTMTTTVMASTAMKNTTTTMMTTTTIAIVSSAMKNTNTMILMINST